MAFHARLAAGCERAADGGRPTQRVAALESRDRSGHAGGHRAAARQEQLGQGFAENEGGKKIMMFG